MSAGRIVFESVSKFYGEVLGVNRVSLSIGPGITSLVGPNGSGKTTLMNLMTGLLRPTRGRVQVLGVPSEDAERIGRIVGYCTQYDSFPRGVTGLDFVAGTLRLHGMTRKEAQERAAATLARVGLGNDLGRKAAGYSKGMRQRARLAAALAHDPTVLVLDEPLNGLDPMARAEFLSLMREFAAEGRHVLLSSHVLHEVGVVSDRVILIHHGYVTAEGTVDGVREEVRDVPAQILVRCGTPSRLASRIFELDSAVEVRLHDDGEGLFVRTKNPDGFRLLLNRLVVEEGIDVRAVAPADGDMEAVYRYLIDDGGGVRS
jgi:ABC-2 type transport system ATP-binding protein